MRTIRNMLSNVYGGVGCLGQLLGYGVKLLLAMCWPPGFWPSRASWPSTHVASSRSGLPVEWHAGTGSAEEHRWGRDAHVPNRMVAHRNSAGRYRIRVRDILSGIEQ